MNKHERIAQYAYEKSLFYRENIEYTESKESENVEFEKLPIVSKDDIVESGFPISPIEYMMKGNKDAIKVSTSGSTGKILTIDWNKKDFLMSMTPLWNLRRKYYGINTWDRMCYFYTIRFLGSKEMMETEDRNTLGFSKTSLNDERLKEIYMKMTDYKPKWLLLQPSTAKMLINTALKYELSPIDTVEYIEFTGEMLTDELRRKVKDFFDCKIANQYGSYEFNSIAYECPYGNMHIMSENVYVEVMGEDGIVHKIGDCNNDDESEKDLIITSLINKRTPFIRYNIGDRGKVTNKIECKCGNHSPIIKLTVGRSHNYAECEDGTRLNAYIFPRAIENVNCVLDDVIKQFQVIQRGINDFLVRLYVDDMSETNAIKEVFERNILEEALKNARYEYSFESEYIKDIKGDKLMYFRKEEMV
ncbi:MAG: phenylacetate--CoA ligase family protein [Lachnospiraceae bacterium]|nr:phenylacetate--CoA ligase family protein [Lachnospiraceae bacterium]